MAPNRTIHSASIAVIVTVFAVWGPFPLFLPSRPALAQVPGPGLRPVQAGRPAIQAAQSGQSDPAEALVRELGSPSFAVRARSTRLLTDMGSPAIPALKRGLKSSIREVRVRSARVLGIVEHRDLEQRLNAFLLDRKAKHNLPGWTSYRSLVGDTGDSRAIFVAMYRDEPHLMRMLTKDSSKLSIALMKRVQALGGNLRYNYRDLKLGTICAMFFLSAAKDVDLPEQVTSNIGVLGNYQAFRKALRANGTRIVVRRLLGVWTKAGVHENYGLSFAIRHDLPEGVDLAKKVLTAKSRRKADIRQLAMLTLAKLGNKEYVPLLERFLTDDALVTKSAARNNPFSQYHTQVRDVALATIITLTGGDHRKLGFTRVTYGSDRLFRSNSIGFPNDEARKKVFDNWRKATGRKVISKAARPKEAATKKKKSSP